MAKEAFILQGQGDIPLRGERLARSDGEELTREHLEEIRQLPGRPTLRPLSEGDVSSTSPTGRKGLKGGSVEKVADLRRFVTYTYG